MSLYKFSLKLDMLYEYRYTIVDYLLYPNFFPSIHLLPSELIITVREFQSLVKYVFLKNTKDQLCLKLDHLQKCLLDKQLAAFLVFAEFN